MEINMQGDIQYKDEPLPKRMKVHSSNDTEDEKNFGKYAATLREIFRETDELDADSLRNFIKILSPIVKHITDTKQCENIVQTFFKCYQNDFSLIYRLVVFIFERIGYNLTNEFNMIDLDKPKQHSARHIIDVTTVIFNALSENVNTLDCSINGVLFSDFIQKCVKTTISLSIPLNLNCLTILQDAVKISPLVMDHLLDEVFTYMLFIYNDDLKSDYEKLLLAIFEIFYKLHRIQNLIARIIPICKSVFIQGKFAILGDYDVSCIKSKSSKNKYKLANIEDILPKAVLEYFTQCVISLASWQVINLFQTLLYHLDTAINKDLVEDVEGKGVVTYVDYLCSLTCQLLLSVRIAEHTVPLSVLSKVNKVMNDMMGLLKKFGIHIVNIEHDPILMGAYLNLCYTWAELCMILKYYSMEKDAFLNLTTDNDFSACNISYLHSYLTTAQWRLLSQRITNFGEKPCKKIMEKLIMQKIRAMLIFESNINEETLNSALQRVLVYEECWKEILKNPFMIKNIIPNMKPAELTKFASFLLQKVIELKDYSHLKEPLVANLSVLTQTVTYVTILSINEVLLKQVTKLGGKNNTYASIKLFKEFPREMFTTPKQDYGEKLLTLSKIFEKEVINFQRTNCTEQYKDIDKKKLKMLLNVLESLPLVYFSKQIQEIIILYLMALLSDFNLSGIKCSENNLEDLLLGIVQNGKVILSEVMTLKSVFQYVSVNIQNQGDFFTHALENMLKVESGIDTVKVGVKYLLENLENKSFLATTFIFLKVIQNCLKKTKFTSEYKTSLNEYTIKISDEISCILNAKRASLEFMEPYAFILKYAFDKNGSEVSLEKLEEYVELALMTTNETDSLKGRVSLFSTVLRNKVKLELVNDALILRIWKFFENIAIPDEMFESYSKLLVLIFEHISSDNLSTLAENLLEEMKFEDGEKCKESSYKLRIWNSVSNCNFNPEKNIIWQKYLDRVFADILRFVHNSNNNESLGIIFDSYIIFATNLVETNHHPLKSTLIDVMFMVNSLILSKNFSNYESTFTKCIGLLATLLKYRAAYIMDMLPSYLQQYRICLRALCKRSDAQLDLTPGQIQNISDCAHKLEKLTKSLVQNSKHLARISPYLVCDILEEFEKTSLNPNVKLHLNTCLFSLLSLCDKHAISYIMRATSSPEVFKGIYENYQKFYRFTGKV